MEKSYGIRWIKLSTSLILAGALFGVDCFTERGMGDGAIYAVLMALGLLYQDLLSVVILCLALSILSPLGYYLSPPAGDEHDAIVGRMISLGVVWVMAVIVYFKKISDKKLLDNENRLREAESAAQIGHYEFNLDTHSFFWSDQICRILGVSPDKKHPELKEFLKLIHPDDLEVVSGRLRESLTTLTPTDSIFRIIRGNGEIRYVHHIANAGSGQPGLPSRRFYGTLQDITESQRVQDLMRQSEERFAKVFTSSPSIKIISRMDNLKIVDVNESFTSAFGYTREEAIGKTSLELGTRLNNPETDAIIEEIKRKGSVRNREVVALTKDKTPRNLLLSSEVVPLNGVDHLLTAMVDVTDKKRTELQLSEISNRFQSFARMSPIGIFHTDYNGDLLFINDKLSEILGLTRVEALGMGWMNVIPPEDREGLKLVWIGAIRSSTPISQNISVRNKRTGQLLQIELKANPIKNQDGSLHGYVGTVEDITEQLKAQKIIADSESWFRNMAENSPVMIWSADDRNVRNYFNSTWLQFTGRVAEEEYENGWMKGIHPGEADRCKKIQQEAFEKKSEFEIEYRLRRSDGKYRWILDRGRPVFSPGSTFTGYVGSCADIHDRHTINIQLEKLVKERTLELTQSLEKEKELSDMKSRFVSMASHEFRTPLSAVLSSVYLVDQYAGPENEANRKKHIARIKSSVKNLVDILNEFLSLDKLEQGKVEINKDWFDFSEFVKDVVEEVKGMQRPGQFVMVNRKGDTNVYQDKKILKNVLLNLLSNAIKYSGERKEILLEACHSGGDMTVAIKDNGIGIPVEEQKHIFTKFFRARNTSNIQGTGLGLNIVQRYVELLGGTISFASFPEQGSTFTLRIPVQPEE
ncbi:MAG: PAS domain-containing sensor histidine kinase [Bacteroidetes bacterium]|nr:PAS domain-containing sensor histidine kinase [Bacteroidota bacterium]